MKFNVHRRLNQRGFVHHVIPVVAFIALFAVVGAYFFLRSSLAATSTYYYYKSAKNSAYCITNVSGVAKVAACSSNSRVTKAAVKGVPAFTVKMNGQCMQASSSGAATFAGCASNTAQWWRNYNSSIMPYNPSTNWCTGSSSVGGQLIKQTSCSTSIYDKWNYVAVTTTSTPPPSGGGGQTSISSFNGVSNPRCYNSVYTTANVHTAYYCVAAVQQMLNTMKQYDKFSATLSVDGQYGTNTYNAVRAYQTYEKISPDGKVGPQTWHYVCWSIYNRGKWTGDGQTSKAWNYAGCNSPAGEHAKP